ncbi:MAG: hypothetical protein AAF745_00720 [Planctomycetota bacterium]
MTHRDNQKSRNRRTIASLVLGLATLGGVGCSTLGGLSSEVTDTECLDEFMINHRNKVMALKAWFRIEACYANHPCVKDLRAGFLDGYMEVATGGSGCTPTVVSPSYWGWRYQCAGGQCAINAWFEGFPLGVKAAEQDGIGHYNQIRLNSTLPYIPQPGINGSMAPTMAPPLSAPPEPVALPPGVELGEGEVLVPGRTQIEDIRAGEMVELDAAAPGTSSTAGSINQDLDGNGTSENPDRMMKPPLDSSQSELPQTPPTIDVKPDPFELDLGQRTKTGNPSQSAQSSLSDQQYGVAEPATLAVDENNTSDSIEQFVTRPVLETEMTLSDSTLLPSQRNESAAASKPRLEGEPKPIMEPTQAEIDSVIEEIFGRPASSSR